MTKVLTVVGARLNSSRLPAKHLLELFHKPLIARVFERLSSLPGEKVLATTSDEYNKPLIDWARKSAINCYSYEGDVNDLMGRIDHVVNIHKPEFIVYICGDCPLVDPDYILQGIEKLRETDNADHATASIHPSLGRVVHEGILMYSMKGWKKLFNASQSKLEKEHVGLAARDENLLKTIYFQERDFTYSSHHRISVDTAADWRFMDALYTECYSNNSHPLNLEWALHRLNHSPSLTNINKHVQQKSGFKQYGKALFITEAGSSKGLGQLIRSSSLAERFCEETGLGIELIILGDSTQHKSIKTLNHQWFTFEELCWDYCAEAQSDIYIFDVFPQRLQSPALFTDLLSHLRERGARLFGIDHMAKLNSYLDQVYIPNIINDNPAADNINFGAEYVILPPNTVSTHDDKEDRFDICITTGGGDAVGYGSWLPGLFESD